MDLLKMSHEIMSIKYGRNIYYLLNPLQLETFEKSLKKSVPSIMVMIFSIYQKRSNRTQSKMFKTDL